MNKSKSYEDDISLKDLIVSILNQKVIIITTTLIVTILVFIFNFFILVPQYESKVSFVMTIPETVETSVGTYSYITTSYSDYLPLLKDHRVLQITIDKLGLDISPSSLEKRVSYTVPNQGDLDKRGIEVVVSGENKEENTMIANVHVESYMEFLNMDFKNKAIDQFLREYNVKLDLTERDIELTEKRLNEAYLLIEEISPVITLQKALNSDSEIAAKYAEDRGINVKDLTESMLYDEVINSNYALMDSLILDYKKSISNNKIERERLTGLLGELRKEQKALDAYYKDGDKSMITEGFLEVFNSKIQIMSPAVIPNVAVSPRRMFNLLIGFVAGLMIGIFSAIVKNYWEKN